MARIELKNLKKEYRKGVVAVEELNLVIEDGEFVCLLGPSGCGKSTTLRMIAGLEDISGGTLLMDDEPANGLSSRERDIAMAFENYALYPHLTVAGNIAFPLRVRKIPEEEVSRKVIEAAELMNIRPLLKESVKDLSGGAQQRVGVARALVRSPRLLLLDEPISHLEEELKTKMREDLRKLQRQIGVTTIYVTHDQIEATVMADRIAIMNLGHLQQYDTPYEVYANPANTFVGGFIGEPPMSFLPCRYDPSGALDFGGFSLPVPPERAEALRPSGGAGLILGVRDIQAELSLVEKPGHFAASVYFIEPRNEEQILSLVAGESSFLVSTSRELVVKNDDRVWVRFDLDRCCFFDRVTGESVVKRSLR